MNRELVIQSTSKGNEIALLEDKALVELHQETELQQYAVGDIVLARVARIMPGLNAAFLEIGTEKHGFLHYSDLGPKIRSLLKFTRLAIEGNMGSDLQNFKFEPETLKTGRIVQVLNKKTNVIVQIAKEPISSKGHRLSCEISLPGRYLVLIPFDTRVSVSKKIMDGDERKRLLRLMESIRPKNFGIIVRTNAEGKVVADLHEDLLELTNKWKQLTAELKGAQTAKKVLSEMNKTSSLLRDMLNESFNKIITNDKEVYTDVRNYISRIAPEKEGIVQFYNNKTPLFDQLEITKQIKSSFGRTVMITGGSYLVIEHTEALHVIDVNSGHKVNNDENQEENALKINLEATKEIARQFRLRDIGGIIVIDFIDVRNPANKVQIFKVMTDMMRSDKARHTILPVTKFGLLQITRERVKPQLTIKTDETCPTCGGTGSIGPSILILDQLEADLAHLHEKHNYKKITLLVHPWLESYIKRGLFFSSLQWKWYRKYKKWHGVDSSDNMALTEYRFFDQNGEEIILEN